MHAVATQTGQETTSARRNAIGTHDHSAAPSQTVRPVLQSGTTLQRKAGCACGGGCSRCQAAHSTGSTLTVNTPGDRYEQEADRIADHVMRMADPSVASESSISSGGTPSVQRACAACSAAAQPDEEEMLQAKESPGTTPGVTPNVQRQIDSMRGGGEPLSSSLRGYFEPRLGHDLGSVRVHTGSQAAETATAVSALAYTVGNNVVFGAGQYSPDTDSGRRLLAHELVHTVQQGATTPKGGAGGASPAGIQRTPSERIQRAPTISVVDENFVGPLQGSQRRAAKSCPINCCSNHLGTLHVMPLFYHASRGAIVAAGSAAATGIGAELHFIADSVQPAAGDLCHCDSYRMIQIITSNDPEDSRNLNNFVDNNNNPTGSPFYGDIGRSGTGEHAIPGGYTDAGQTVSTTESIYDRPYRTEAMLRANLPNASLSWVAETCVACIKNNAPDRILGCATYGFTQRYDSTSDTYDPVAEISPGCLGKASANFISTLTSDASTTGKYDFLPAPGFIECYNPGDYPIPPDNGTRYA